MAEGMTGQAIHEMYQEQEFTSRPWDFIGKQSQNHYNMLAEKLNAQYLVPLQGLVRDWRELVQAHDEMSVMSLAEIEGWNKDWEELKQRTAQLLKGEQKVKE